MNCDLGFSWFLLNTRIELVNEVCRFDELTHLIARFDTPLCVLIHLFTLILCIFAHENKKQ